MEKNKKGRDSYNKKIKYAVAVVFFVIAATVYLCVSVKSPKDDVITENEGLIDFSSYESLESESVETQATSSEISLIYVYVCGQVMQEGVYTLPEGSRVCDAIEAAGGLSLEGVLTGLNLAELIYDGEKIYVPSDEEASDMSETLVSASMQSASGLININTADLTLLMTLPGIGESRAQSIIDYRKEHGSFRSIEDIMLVSGIKEAAFSKIKNKICVK